MPRRSLRGSTVEVVPRGATETDFRRPGQVVGRLDESRQQSARARSPHGGRGHADQVPPTGPVLPRRVARPGTHVKGKCMTRTSRALKRLGIAGLAVVTIGAGVPALTASVA